MGHVSLRGQGGKPTLSALITHRHCLTPNALQSVCGEGLTREILAATHGERVSREAGEEILRGINTLASASYTLANVSEASFIETFNVLQERHQFEVVSLAREARVHQVVVISMLDGTPVHREQAVKVLAALSQRTGRSYTLDSVSIKLIEEPGGAQ